MKKVWSQQQVIDLAKQAGIRIDSTGQVYSGWHTVYIEQLEKFAEIVVRSHCRIPEEPVPVVAPLSILHPVDSAVQLFKKGAALVNK